MHGLVAMFVTVIIMWTLVSIFLQLLMKDSFVKVVEGHTHVS